jgi:prepilin-type N-terminal cleavage/methylation domain-containing protein
MKVMMAQRIKALKRREAAPRGRPDAFTLIELLVTIAIVTLVTGIPAWPDGSAEPNSLAQTLAAIRDEMTKSPAPWPQAWQEEYVETIRQVALAHRDSPGYAARLEMLRNGFAPYWEAVPKNGQRSLFEVRQAEIRWYVENLMIAELPTDSSREKLREQYKGLVEYATEALLRQFPFLDPNRVRQAQADHLGRCYRLIESPLLPTFRSPFTEAQVDQLKERWTNLRYARVDLWRQLGGGAATSAKKTPVASGNAHPDYRLTQRSLDQLRGQVWSLIPTPPAYYRGAVAKEAAAQKKRVQSRAEAHAQEVRLGVAVWQTEYLSFLVGALLETARSFPEEEE